MSGPAEERAEGGLVCRDFLRNSCRRGKRCKFRHTVNGNADEANNNNNNGGGGGGNEELQLLFCHDFQNRGCPRVNCRFVHCSSEEEQLFRLTGRLPFNATVSAHLQGLLPSQLLHGESPVCTEFLRGGCRRGPECKYRHLNVAQVVQLSMEPPAKRQRRFSGDAEARLASLQDENHELKRLLDELRRQLDNLAAANEVLLEQNARLRLNPVVSLPSVTITSAADGPPVTIATVAPCSVTQVSLASAGISIAPPIVTVAQPICVSAPTPASQAIPITITGTSTSLVPFPIVTHVHSTAQ